jgi:hypothetical protein
MRKVLLRAKNEVMSVRSLIYELINNLCVAAKALNADGHKDGSDKVINAIMYLKEADEKFLMAETSVSPE